MKQGGWPKPSIGILKQELDRIDEDYADDNEYDEATTDAVDTATLLFWEPSDQELALLKQMREWAEKACAQTRLEGRQLIDWLNTHIRPNGNGATSGSSSSPSTGPRRTG